MVVDNCGFEGCHLLKYPERIPFSMMSHQKAMAVEIADLGEVFFFRGLSRLCFPSGVNLT